MRHISRSLRHLSKSFLTSSMRASRMPNSLLLRIQAIAPVIAPPNIAETLLSVTSFRSTFTFQFSPQVFTHLNMKMLVIRPLPFQ